MITRTLPTLAPRFTSFEVHSRGDGVYDLRLFAGDGPGFRCANDSAYYEALSAVELVDVILASLDGLYGPI